ncbi:EthD family reductase [Acidisoma cellulosilytica]|uniref:EthD family reductase n=1 Tax=Acidisoma cellulosilyticum TaxID=2802395 RepID=A0A963Z2V3_9PROT|nr:EthD family reductase [Acidisoma cellulosilyticum]MCB8881601.1 EthD family reductase [Acidisoma cellulosilyticum]
MTEYGRNGEVIMFVTYQGSAESRFDRSYYVERHLPMLRRLFGALGLTSAEVFFPPTQGTGTIAICECRYRDEDAFTACMTSAGMPGIAADVGNFTDIMPVHIRGKRV